MLNLKLLSTFTLSSMAFVGVMGNHLITNSISEKRNVDLTAFKNLYANISTFHEANHSEENQSEIKREELVLNSISKEIEKTIKTNKKIVVIAKKNETHTISDEVKTSFSGVKKQTVLPEKISASLKNSELEINNTDDLKTKKFSYENVVVEKINVNNFLIETRIDQVKEVAASSKSIEIEKKIENNEIDNNDDLVVFDYNKNVAKPSIDQKLYERPISSTVKNVIKREMNSMPKLSTEFSLKENSKSYDATIVNELTKNLEENKFQLNSEETKNEAENEDQIIYDYSSTKRSTDIKPFLGIEKSAFTSAAKQVQVNIKSLNVNLLTSKKTGGSSFEFEPDYDRNERTHDNNSGEINLNLSVADENGILTGVFIGRDLMPTRTDVLMNTHNLVVPMFDEGSYKEFLLKYGSETESSLLLSTTEDFKDAEIDSEYSRKIFLDANFKPSETNKKFIMFLGVKSGNILVKYNVNGSTAQKIIFVGESEVFFEEPSFSAGEREVYELVTRNLLSTGFKELNLSNRDVKVFNTNVFSKKSGLNAYELKMPASVFGSRKYLEVKHDNNAVFVGTQKEGKLEIPSKEFVGKILEGFKIQDLNDKCLLQINIENEVERIKSTGKNGSGEMFTETMYLDDEGNLSDTEKENTQKMFVLGENEGIISVNLEYANGTTENLKSYCSNGTFLIEQLK